MDPKQISEIRQFIWELAKDQQADPKIRRSIRYLRLLLDSNQAMQRKMFRLRERLREAKGDRDD